MVFIATGSKVSNVAFSEKPALLTRIVAGPSARRVHHHFRYLCRIGNIRADGNRATAGGSDLRDLRRGSVGASNVISADRRTLARNLRAIARPIPRAAPVTTAT